MLYSAFTVQNLFFGDGGTVDYPIQTLSQLRPILQSFRKKAGLTQAAVAGKLGITQQSYAQIEANPGATSVERLHKILRLLDVDLVLMQSQAAATNDMPAPVKLVSPAPKRESW